MSFSEASLPRVLTILGPRIGFVGCFDRTVWRSGSSLWDEVRDGVSWEEVGLLIDVGRSTPRDCHFLSQDLLLFSDVALMGSTAIRLISRFRPRWCLAASSAAHAILVSSRSDLIPESNSLLQGYKIPSALAAIQLPWTGR